MVQQNQRISAASATSNNATGIRVLGVDDHAVRRVAALLRFLREELLHRGYRLAPLEQL